MPRKQAAKSAGKAPAPTPLATPPEVAEYLRKPVGTLKEWRWRGTGPRYTRQGRDVRYDWEDVYAWVRDNQPEMADAPRPDAA